LSGRSAAPSNQTWPASGPDQAGGQAQQRGLAAAAGADQHRGLALGAVQVDAGEREGVAVAFLDGVESKHRRRLG
jgi:hypothetical protein